MKIITIICFVFLSLNSNAQNKLVGRYRDYFGNHIQLNPDNTFKYTWNFDMQSSWTKGTWTLVKDTIFFLMVPIYDTLSYTNRNNLTADTLILSTDEKPERLSSIENDVLLSYGQNYRTYPIKLFFRKGRLYNIYNGSLVSKKQKGFWTKKKWNPWYFKSAD